MPKTVIDVMFEEFSTLIVFLEKKGEVSLQSMIDSIFKKTLALSAASFFEEEIRGILLKLFAERSANDELISNFLQKQALERQYHKLFRWDGNNANSFFSLFGEHFKDSACQDVNGDPELAEAIRVFLYLGETRNELAHLNFASFALEATAEEIYNRYQKAFSFILYLRKKLLKYGRSDEQPTISDDLKAASKE